MNTKVTIKPPREAKTPTEEVLQAATQPFSVTDSIGRVIILKKPGILAQFDLIEALGELAKNDVYRMMCIPAIYVQSIDGNPAPPPTNKAQMRALISRLGEEGFNAIRAGIDKHYPKQDDGEDEEALKNS
jgi:hypothetical protein